MKTLSTIALATALLIACGKKDKEAAPAPAPVPAQGSGSAVAAGSDSGSGSAVAAGSGAETPPADEPLDVATEMDYEDLANTEITEATLEPRLKALEAELSAQ